MADAKTFRFPELSLVVLLGASGSGKSTFARRHFKPTEVVSSDFCRGLVSDDESSMDASKDAFDVLHFIAGRRLARGKLTVIDATNVTREARAPLVALAREYHCLPVAIVLDMPEKVCLERNASRPDRDFGKHVVRNHIGALRRSRRSLQKEGFRHVFALESEEAVNAAVLIREKLWNDRRDDAGPFDLVGDVHGCFDELHALLGKLGYSVVRETADDGGLRFAVTPPPSSTGTRKAVFLGDLVDRGPKSPEVLRLVMDMCASGAALCVPGNHDVKLMRKLRGRDVQITHGLAESLAQMKREPAGFAARVTEFVDDLVSHFVLDGGNLVVAHAGMRETMQGRGSGKVREFALYGETTGETDEYGLPVRYEWAADYRGRAHVVYGHTPVPEPEWLNKTMCIDTGCVFGGKLTALRWPEKELVCVQAAATYYQPTKPFLPEGEVAPTLTAQQEHDDVLDLADVSGRRAVSTRLMNNVTLREENTHPALEVMSRFAASPKWLIYLPPTMSPPETSSREGHLEHPDEAFSYFRGQGVAKVVCQEKHMGSRAVLVVGRDANAVRRRFGVATGESGACVTRTGRRFFTDPAMETALINRVRAAADAAGLWTRFDTEWFALDAELMPWSAKAQELLRTQYAAVGAAATVGLGEAGHALAAAAQRGIDVAEILDRTTARADRARLYVESYGRYCWPVASVDDLRLAPFHLLATEGAVHVDRDHLWHLGVLDELVAAGGVLQPTRRLVVDLTDPASEAAGAAWWEELTGAGGEGMVVKPLDFVVRGPRQLAQPAVKCRGREYLRIIYGPDYDLPENLARLRKRGLSTKRSLALREFALGVEALERFVRKEPLRRVHECVFGVLALETEPVDPRL
ncbi:MAG: polynucleotide kinase-phosphatase [Planctomycetes bacterium]|nr:polynucleotide kinase-phosphatase [Planctomycetota bacterium]